MLWQVANEKFEELLCWRWEEEKTRDETCFVFCLLSRHVETTISEFPTTDEKSKVQINMI